MLKGFVNADLSCGCRVGFSEEHETATATGTAHRCRYCTSTAPELNKRLKSIGGDAGCQSLS